MFDQTENINFIEKDLYPVGSLQSYTCIHTISHVLLYVGLTSLTHAVMPLK